ncbi:hypothetical protein [Hoeflea sp.]|uniref:hypothetical protein n=1 Tax=Hoeflea sp. TaxID=1940281 RepID=UPI003B5182E1
MADEFYLTSPFIGEYFRRNITPEEFSEISTSKADLILYMNFEEAFLQLTKTYQEFEKYILENALDFLLFAESDYNYFQDSRVLANIRVLSILNSITSIRDQAPRLKDIRGKHNLRERLLELWNQEKENSITFAFTERFRNYAQHQTQPVHSTTTGGSWDASGSLCEHHTSAFAKVSDVCGNRKINQNERDSYINEFGEYADICLLIRESMASIGRINDSIRSEFKETIDYKISRLDSYLEYGEGKTLDAVHIHNSEIHSKIPIFHNFIKRINDLRSNVFLKNNHKHFITNRYRGHSNSRKIRISMNKI